ncbi:protein of unknown function [Cyclobacterium xiamenense]|uniref:DUF748 domain-containing protein n=1 Tax=Cyclobacterium xiamenense TaxID=1297121 RepID=A0A1H7BBD2_9BACT|nr:DUF748 domain-containing protein [Cyclobacterium xiamenense]SEJ74738.1 protein of unknown function [Cyclobacterium xiamenense]
MKPLSRTLSIFLGVVVLLLIVLFLGVPAFLKDYLEKNDRELVGREIFLEDLSIHWFSGQVELEGLEIREKDTANVFLFIDKLSTRISLPALVNRHFFIRSLDVEGLSVEIVQKGMQFNFDDLYQPTDTEIASPEVPEANPWRFTLANIALREGEVNYHSDIAPFLGFDSIAIEIPRITEAMDTLTAHVALRVSSGGQIESVVGIRPGDARYSLRMQATDVDLQLVEPYFRNVMKLGNLSGKLLADFHVEGSWEDTDRLDLSGSVGLRNFEMTDPEGKALLAADLMEVAVDTIRMKEGVYAIDRLHANGLYSIFELYEEGNNFSRLLLTEASTSEEPGVDDSLDYSNPFLVLAYYLQGTVRSYQESVYEIRELSIAESEFRFVDYTLPEPFRYKFTEMRLLGDSLYSSREKFTIHLGAGLNDTGIFEGEIVSFTSDPSNMDIRYTVSGTGLPPFAPYTSFYVAHPIATGEMWYTCETSIREGIITSSNLVEIDDFNFGEKTGERALYDLPVRLAVSLLKDLEGKISLDIPVEGDLNDPNYRLGKVIWSTVRNILLKAVTAPYRLLARSFQVKEEDLKSIQFGLLQTSLNKEQERQLTDLAKVLHAKPELNVAFKRVTDRYDEVERYALSQSWTNYLFGDTIPERLNEAQKKQLDEPDPTDSLFRAFVNSAVQVPDSVLTLEEQCLVYIGEEAAVATVDRIGSRRGEAIADYLSTTLEVPEERLQFRILPADSLISNKNSAIYHIDFWVDDP